MKALSSNHKIQAQFRSGDYEFVAAGGDTPQEFEQALGALIASLPLVREVQAELALGTGSQQAANPTPQQPAANTWNSSPAPAQTGSASGVPGVSCPHGPMTRRTGNSARGPWTGYFCPLPKGSPDQCKPRFQD